MSEHGYLGIITTFDVVVGSRSFTGPRRFGLLTASKTGLMIDEHSRDNLQLVWPERILSTKAKYPDGANISIQNVHVPPGSSNGWRKIEVFEGLRQYLDITGGRKRVVAGDFNSPQIELPDGRIVAWGQRVNTQGEIVSKGTRGKLNNNRWSRGELSIIQDHSEVGLQDTFRNLHGHKSEASSWVLNRKGRQFNRRYDHVFVDQKWRVEHAAYKSSWRKSGLSDHAPLIVDTIPS